MGKHCTHIKISICYVSCQTFSFVVALILPDFSVILLLLPHWYKVGKRTDEPPLFFLVPNPWDNPGVLALLPFLGTRRVFLEALGRTGCGPWSLHRHQPGFWRRGKMQCFQSMNTQAAAFATRKTVGKLLPHIVDTHSNASWGSNAEVGFPFL